MIYRSGLLAVLVCVQLLVVAGVFYLDAADSASDAGELFLDFSADSVDRIVVSESESQVTLHKRAEGWVVGDDLPADGEKIAEVLEKLAELRGGWPVATSPSTQDRFEVASENHQRHLELYQGEALAAEFYLGSSPGYRRVHARAEGSDDIFSVDFSTFEAPTGADDWLDKTVLGATGDITRISRDGMWALTKSADGWVFDASGAEAGAAADQDAATGVAERLRNLRVMGVADSAAQGQVPAVITVSDEEGDQVLSFWHDGEEDEYVVGSNRADSRFTVASYIAEQILIAAEDLVVSDEQIEDEESPQ